MMLIKLLLVSRLHVSHTSKNNALIIYFRKELPYQAEFKIFVEYLWKFLLAV